MDKAVTLSVNQDAYLSAQAVAHACHQRVGHFHIPVCLRLDGVLCVRTLEQAINAFIARHDALRTEFPDVGRLSRSVLADLFRSAAHLDGWKQPIFSGVVRAQAGISLSVRRTADAAIERMTHVPGPLICEEAVRPMPEHCGPLVKATLFHTGGNRHLLLVVFHHLVCDRWSVGIFLQELCALYRQIAATPNATSVAPPKHQYSDFVHWQRALLSFENTLSRVGVWQTHYRDCAEQSLAMSDLPMLRPRRRYESNLHGLRCLPLGPAISRSMNRYCRERGVTCYTLCLAVVFLLCHLYSKRTKLTLWGAFANRRPGYEGVVGWLSEGRALGVVVSPEMCFDGLVDAVRRVVHDTVADQHLPLAAIQRASPGTRRDQSEPLHLTIELWDRTLTRPMTITEALSATLIRVPYNRTTAPNVLRLTIDPGPEVIARCVFETGRVSSAGVRRLLSEFRTVMASCLSCSTQPLGSFEPVRRTAASDA